jgi:hypothetical protein
MYLTEHVNTEIIQQIFMKMRKTVFNVNVVSGIKHKKMKAAIF